MSQPEASKIIRAKRAGAGVNGSYLITLVDANSPEPAVKLPPSLPEPAAWKKLHPYEQLRHLLESEGLSVPAIPEPLRAVIVKKSVWTFSSRDLPTSPYNMEHYVEETDGRSVKPYVVLAHAGHGVTSYGLHYFLVWNGLELFVRICWGGVYGDPEESSRAVRDAFQLADRLLKLWERYATANPGGRLRVVADQFSAFRNRLTYDRPTVVGHNLDRTINEAIQWVEQKLSPVKPKGSKLH